MAKFNDSAIDDRADGASSASAGNTTSALTPTSEAPAPMTRRQFSGANKHRILLEADGCTRPGEMRALMQREGIHSSMVANWRKQRSNAGRVGLAPQKRGPKADGAMAARRHVARMERENLRLRVALERARVTIDTLSNQTQCSTCANSNE